jgi:hypothetical protein
MNEPWLERQGDERPEPSIYNFVIFCEDDVSEPDYFESFRKDQVVIVTAHRGQKHKRLNVEKAIAYCVENGLIKYIKGVPTPMFEEGFQVCCVFDRDRNREEEANILDETSFNTSIKLAHDLSINVAWSNDAFEIWVLLHVEDIEGKEAELTHRDTYYEKLVAYFKSLQAPPEILQRKLAGANFSYDSIKSRKVFIPVVLPILKSKTQIAIERAKKLEALHTHKPFHERVPCTTVHHLVLQLIEKAK